MQGHPIKWFTDNQNVVSIVKFGSKKPHLQDGAVSIFDKPNFNVRSNFCFVLSKII